MSFKISSLLIALVCISLFSIEAKASLDEKVIKELQEESIKIHNLQEEKEFAKKLRMLAREDSELVLNLYLIAAKCRENIRKSYPFISDAEMEEAKGSVGVALFNNGSRNENEVIEVLLREASLLSAPAQIMLKIIYKNKVGNYPAQDGRILNFFKERAEEGFTQGLDD